MANVQEGPERFDEAHVRQVLRRAMEIDDLVAHTIDSVELQEIATSVGISPTALDLALDELRSEEKARRRTLKWLRRVRRVIGVAAAAMLGLLSTSMQALFGHEAGVDTMLGSLALLVTVVVLLVVYNRFRGDQRTYQIDNATIWATFTLASRPVSAVAGGVPPGVLAWLGLTVLGFFLIGGRRAEPPGLSREKVMDKVVKSVRDRAAQDAATERRRISCETASSGGFNEGSLPAATS
jgi:cation transport ATPase